MLSEDDGDDSDATDILGDDDSAEEEYPEVPDTLPQELMSELEEDDS